jgi:hypothetical protein
VLVGFNRAQWAAQVSILAPWNSGAVVDRGELVVLLAHSRRRFNELHVDLDTVTGQGLLVVLPAVGVALAAPRSRQTAHVELVRDLPDPRGADGHVVVTLQVHRDLVGPEVVMLAQVDDLAHHVGRGLVRAGQGH